MSRVKCSDVCYIQVVPINPDSMSIHKRSHSLVSLFYFRYCCLHKLSSSFKLRCLSMKEMDK